jgi:hypothetical protein
MFALRLVARRSSRSPLLARSFQLAASSTSRRPAPACIPRLLRTFTPSPANRDASQLAAAPAPEHEPVFYTGPLTATFRRLKMFSVASLGLSFAMTPFIFTIGSALPLSARATLAGTALLTSSLSTALVTWAGSPYVTRMRRLPAAPAPATHADGDRAPSHNALAPAGIELETLTLTLRPRRTRVYDPVFLADARRPLARWELARLVQLPDAEAHEVRPGMEETVAETLDAEGNVVGRWIVVWREGGEGVCRGQGRIVRCVFRASAECIRWADRCRAGISTSTRTC